MRTNLALDDDLVRIAQEFTGISEKTALIREALKSLLSAKAPAGWPAWVAQCRS